MSPAPPASPPRITRPTPAVAARVRSTSGRRTFSPKKRPTRVRLTPDWSAAMRVALAIDVSLNAEKKNRIAPP